MAVTHRFQGFGIVENAAIGKGHLDGSVITETINAALVNKVRHIIDD